jgi:hypothetical protein
MKAGLYIDNTGELAVYDGETCWLFSEYDFTWSELNTMEFCGTLKFVCDINPPQSER